jgi:DNA polymerase-3 subunit epsilon
MPLLKENTFICLDCEATGLDVENDKIIEIAAIKFTLNKKIKIIDTLINPMCDIPEESQKIHNISNKMVQKKPKIDEILPYFLEFIDNHIIVGHGIKFDIDIISKEALRHKIPCNIKKNFLIDTLRLARLYGECPVNSLEMLCQHFNIEVERSHRALNDVLVNIEIFKRLIKPFDTVEKLLDRLKKPILMKKMPLGKYKGRKFSEIPMDYLKWSAKKNFDEDLLYSIRLEIKNRKKEENFNRASNPFSNLK